MTHAEHNRPARRRGELARDRGSRLSRAIDAQRRLNGRRSDGTRIKADPFGPTDARYTYRMRVHD